MLLDSGWVSEWLVVLCWAPPERRSGLEFMGGAGALAFFKSDTHASPKRTATDLTLGLKCEAPLPLGYYCKI